MPTKFSDEELLNHLIELSEQLDRIPTYLDCKYSKTTYLRRFGGFGKALELAGVTFEQMKKREIVHKFNFIMEDLGRVPYYKELPFRNYIKDYYGGYSHFLRELELLPHVHLTKQELIDQLKAYIEEVGEVPSIEYINEHSSFSTGVYVLRFGSWSNALLRAGYEPTRNLDLKKLSNELFFKEYIELSNKLGRFLNGQQIDAHFINRYTQGMVASGFGSIRQLKEKAMNDPSCTLKNIGYVKATKYSNEKLIILLQQYKKANPFYFDYNIRQAKRALSDLGVSYATIKANLKTGGYDDFKALIDGL